MISQQTTLHSAGGSHIIRSGYSRSVFSHTGGVALLELRSLLKPIFRSELSTSKTAPNTARPPPTAPIRPKIQVLVSQFGTKGIFDIWVEPVIHLIHTQSSSSVVASYLTLLSRSILFVWNNWCMQQWHLRIAYRRIYFIYCQQITMISTKRAAEQKRFNWGHLLGIVSDDKGLSSLKNHQNENQIDLLELFESQAFGSEE